MTKQNIITLSSSILVLLLMVIYISYAITPYSSISNLSVTANTGTPMIFTASGGNTISASITVDSMEQGSSTSIASAKTDNMTVTLTSDGKEKMCCSYSFVWNYSSNNTAVPSKADEFIISAKSSGTYTGNTGNVAFATNTTEFTTSLASSGTITLGNSSICNENDGVLSTSVTKIYNLSLNIYNVADTNQDYLKGKTISGNITITNPVCTNK